jgi:hypothetical protein
MMADILEMPYLIFPDQAVLDLTTSPVNTPRTFESRLLCTTKVMHADIPPAMMPAQTEKD